MNLEYPGKLSEEEILSGVPADASLRWKVSVRGASEADDNHLYYGDNLPVLRMLLDNPDVAGKVRLVYIDPPFATGRAFTTRDGRAAYTDSLVGHEFLEFLRHRLVLLRELLSEDGSIYVHIDSTIGHYVKVVMDEVFGASCFRNDISRIKCNPKNFSRKAYGNVKDTILFYSKAPVSSTDPLLFKDHRAPLTDAEIEKQFPKRSALGKRYATTPLHAPGETRNGPTGEVWRDMKPPVGRHWRYPPVELEKLDRAGLIEWSSTGNPRKIIYADENRGRKVQDVWEYKDKGAERSSYPTEKNLDLLHYIIANSSEENDLVLDAFAGSGTTLVAANQLGRKWIGIDASPLGMSVCQTRLTTLSGDDGTLASFSLYQAEVVPRSLAVEGEVEWVSSEPDSLLAGDFNLELNLSRETGDPALGPISRILVDPDYVESKAPTFSEVVPMETKSPRSGNTLESRFKLSLDSATVGDNILILVLHETGKETIKVLNRKSRKANAAS